MPAQGCECNFVGASYLDILRDGSTDYHSSLLLIVEAVLL